MQAASVGPPANVRLVRVPQDARRDAVATSVHVSLNFGCMLSLVGLLRYEETTLCTFAL